MSFHLLTVTLQNLLKIQARKSLKLLKKKYFASIFLLQFENEGNVNRIFLNTSSIYFDRSDFVSNVDQPIC